MVSHHRRYLHRQISASIAIFPILLGGLLQIPKLAQAKEALQPSKKVASTTSKAAKKQPGWMFETVVKTLGCARYYITADAFRAEYPMFIVYADLRKFIVTIGSWETKKCFSFPMAKSKYYLSLMGFSIHTRHDNDFTRQYKMSEWRKVRDVEIQELPAIEYERHVLNPPPGRTRSQIQVLFHPEMLPEKFFVFYNDFVLSDPAKHNMILLDDKTVVTNPPAGWVNLSTKVAKKVSMTAAEMSFPKGFKRVETVSEITMNDNQHAVPSIHAAPSRGAL